MDGEDVAVRGVVGSVAVAVVEDLHFDGAEKRDAGRGERAGPDEDACVACRFEMPPFEFEDEIFVLARCAQCAGGLAIAMDHSIHDAPCFRPAVHVHPAIERLAIEERDEAVVIGEEAEWQREEKEGGEFHSRDRNRTLAFRQASLSLRHYSNADWMRRWRTHGAGDAE